MAKNESSAVPYLVVIFILFLSSFGFGYHVAFLLDKAFGEKTYLVSYFCGENTFGHFFHVTKRGENPNSDSFLLFASGQCTNNKAVILGISQVN